MRKLLLLCVLFAMLVCIQAQQPNGNTLQSLFKSIKKSVQTTVEKLQQHDLVRKAKEKVKSWFKHSKPFANAIVKDVSKARSFPVQIFSMNKNSIYKLEIAIPNRNKDAYKVKKIGKQNAQQIAVQLLPREKHAATDIPASNKFLRGKQHEEEQKNEQQQQASWALVLDEYDYGNTVLERTFEFAKVIERVEATYKDGTLQVLVHLSNKSAAQDVQIDFVPIN